MRRRILIPIGALAAALLAAPAAPAFAADPVITGTVTLGGAARAGVPVAWFEPGGSVLTSTTTDASGHYSLPAPASGTSYIVAADVATTLSAPHSASRGWLATYAGDGTATAAAAQLVTPAVAGTGDRALDVTVPKATTVRGKDAAFASRTVWLKTLDDRTAASVKASSSGSWSFEAAPGHYRIGARVTTKYLEYRSQPFTVGVTTVVKGTAPERFATLAGVTTSHGKPIAGVYVTRVVAAESETVEDVTRTDSHGRFRFTGVVPGAYVLRFGAGDMAKASASDWIASSRRGTTASGRTTTLHVGVHRGAEIIASFSAARTADDYGLLLERTDGTLLRSARFVNHPGKTNRVKQVGLGKGTYLLELTDRTHQLVRTITVGAGQRRDIGTVRLTADPLVLTGHAPAGSLLTASRGAYRASTHAATDGTYRITGLVPGEYTVTDAPAAEEETTSTRTVDVESDTTLDLPAAPAPVPSFAVTGRVLAGAIPFDAGQAVLGTKGSFNVAKGALLSASLPAGSDTVTGIRIFGSASFPVGTPYDLAWPATPLVVGNGPTDIGTVHLVVTGG